ncbi:MAG: terminase large subunit, partial [Oscillospiraceae bacterium]|nr:terminase large subunit [Oscillospiraceae bacterium]
MNYIQKYHNKSNAGELNVGKYIFRLYNKIIAGIQSGLYTFDASKAEKAIMFIENYCRHSKGRNDLLKLELWQKAFLSIMFGIVDKNGLRWFREVFVIIGRKNGKSLVAAAIMAYMAFVGGEYGAEIYCVATKKEQAKIVYDCFTEMIRGDDELSELVKFRKEFLRIPESNILVKPLPATPESFDGLNPELVICDEVAAWRSENGIKQYEVLKSAQGARNQPLILSITTAGYESGSLYDELFKRGTQFLNGDTRENRLLPVFYTIDDEL